MKSRIKVIITERQPNFFVIVVVILHDVKLFSDFFAMAKNSDVLFDGCKTQEISAS